MQEGREGAAEYGRHSLVPIHSLLRRARPTRLLLYTHLVVNGVANQPLRHHRLMFKVLVWVRLEGPRQVVDVTAAMRTHRKNEDVVCRAPACTDVPSHSNMSSGTMTTNFHCDLKRLSTSSAYLFPHLK